MEGGYPYLGCYSAAGLQSGKTSQQHLLTPSSMNNQYMVHTSREEHHMLCSLLSYPQANPFFFFYNLL